MRRRGWIALLVAALGCGGPASGDGARAVAAATTPAAAAPAAATSAPAVAERELAPAAAAAAGMRIEDDPERALAASVYSFPSTLIAPAAARALLGAIRARDAGRRILVLADAPMAAALAGDARRLDVDLLQARGGPYSPWPRDPFSFARARSGAVVLVARPNQQRGREADSDMAREIARDLPPDLARAWDARWTRAAVPFHNGQVLLTRDEAWVSIHTFEPRALALLGVDRVPVEDFGSAAGVRRYVGAVESAADELGKLYGRRVRFVHPLPAPGADDATAAALMRELGGGAGYDLDSVLTVLTGGGREVALVADVAAGERLAAGLPADDRARLRAGYDLDPAVDPAAAIARENASPRGRALGTFLDLVAAELGRQGLSVGRLPLLLVPVSALRASGGLDYPHFLIGWNNVVVERRGGATRAEGFSSLLPTGDRLAEQAFARAGARLDLLPPLVESVVRNGGYRCASNHLRAP